MRRTEEGYLISVEDDYKVLKNLINYTLELIKEGPLSTPKDGIDPEVIRRYVEVKVKKLILMFYPIEVFETLGIEYVDGNIKVNCKLLPDTVIVSEADNRKSLEFSTLLILETPVDKQS